MMRAAFFLTVCCLIPAAVLMRMAPQMNPNDIIRNEEDPLSPSKSMTPNRPKPGPMMPPTMPPKPSPLLAPQVPPAPPAPQVPQNPQQPQQPQQPQPQPQVQQAPPNPQMVQSQKQTQSQGRPVSQTRAQPDLRRQAVRPQQSARQQAPPPPPPPQPAPQVQPQNQVPMQMPVPALVMILPNHQMPLLLPGGQPSIMMPQPHLMSLAPGPPQPGVAGAGIPTEGAKSADLQTGFNPWNLGLDELQALVNQFRTSVTPTVEVVSGPNAGQPSVPTNVPTGTPPVIPAPLNPAIPNGQPPLVPVAGPNPQAVNEVKTEESAKPREGDNPTSVPEAGQNGTAAAGEANRRRSVMHNPIDQQHNTVETRFSQSPTKMNMGAVCEGVAAAKAPACVAEQKWEEIMRQEIDCGLQRKREWRCYCGFFEGDDLPPQPASSLPPRSPVA